MFPSHNLGGAECMSFHAKSVRKSAAKPPEEHCRGCSRHAVGAWWRFQGDSLQLRGSVQDVSVHAPEHWAGSLKKAPSCYSLQRSHDPTRVVDALPAGV